MNAELSALVITAASIGFLHTLLGPDHYLPFIMMSWARKWSRTKTLVITFLCGLGHIASSIILGMIGVSMGLAVKKLEITDNSILMIENVGNLVCPSMFDLGESKRVVIISVTEGEDKPIKYPNMFQSSNICVINKTDLLPYVDFDIDKCKDYALKVNHHLQFFELSVKTGEGMDKWYEWLKKEFN